MSSSYLPFRSPASYRGTSKTECTNNTSNSTHTPAPPQDSDVAPSAPIPRPIFQLLAFALFIALALLQLLPATHFRHPYDPHRNWVPFHSNTSSSFREIEVGDSRNGEYTGEDGMVHVVSWMDCVDLRVLAVLANSTLSSSRYPNLVHFHFFIPGGDKDRVSFYKLKVLFPDSNLEIYGQEEVKSVVRTAFSGVQYAEPRMEEIAPFIIPSVHQFLGKFIYVSANVIMKVTIASILSPPCWIRHDTIYVPMDQFKFAEQVMVFGPEIKSFVMRSVGGAALSSFLLFLQARVEELVGTDLSYYAIAAAEDCSERLNTYVNSDVLGAIQRSASMPWVSKTPYAKDACLPDMDVLLINARKLEIDFVEAVLWWCKVLNLTERNGRKSLAVALALYDRYLKLSSSWLAKDLTCSGGENNLVIYFDGPKTVCTESSRSSISHLSNGTVWSQYLPSLSGQILGM